MRMIDNHLCFTGKAEATVYFDSCPGGFASFKTEMPLSYRLCDAYGREIVSGCAPEARLELDGTGSFRLTFLPHKEGTAKIRLYCDDGVMPYIMPGVGVLWDHGVVFPLLLARRQSHTLWVPTSEDDSTAVAVIKGIDYGEDADVTADGAPFAADWYPKMDRQWYWHSAELPSAKLIRFDLPEGKSDIRFTVYNRTVVLLEEPKRPLVLGRLSVSVSDGNGRSVDSRVEVFVGNERVAMYDKLSDENACIRLPRGVYRVKVSHGIFWSEAETEVRVSDGDIHIDMDLKKTVTLPEGGFGELHTHSALEDATLFPRQVMRAARACGKHFCFMTDKSVERLEHFGLHDCDRKGVFSAFPEQEIMCHELHTNVLNPSHTIDNPEAEALGAVNHDIEEKIGSWLAQYRSMKESRPCLIMHNHPEHRAEVMRRGQPYFRSWWVSDMFSEDYHLVENCGFEGWFDRLNRGRKLFAAWTRTVTASRPLWSRVIRRSLIRCLLNRSWMKCNNGHPISRYLRGGGHTVALVRM